MAIQYRLRTILLLPVAVAATAALAWFFGVRLAALLWVIVVGLLGAREANGLFRRAYPTRARRWVASLVVAAVCLELPFSWLVLIDYPWSSYRWGWMMTWPLLPSLLWIWIFSHSDRLLVLTAAGCANGALFFLLAWWVRRGGWATMSGILAGLAFAGYSAWGAYAVFVW